MTRPLKVGEYRKVKTWDQLLAIEKGPGVVYSMKDQCGKVVEVTEVIKGETDIDGWAYIAEFFTDETFDENGNEIKEVSDIKVGNKFIHGSGNWFTIKSIDEECVLIKWRDGREISNSTKYLMSIVDNGTFIKDLHTDPLDTLEHEANQTLTQISKLREIDLKQAKMEKMGKELEQMIDELKELMNG